jgi:hypothetical protein
MLPRTAESRSHHSHADTARAIDGDDLAADVMPTDAAEHGTG